jgi:hypothetical protein
VIVAPWICSSRSRPPVSPKMRSPMKNTRALIAGRRACARMACRPARQSA